MRAPLWRQKLAQLPKEGYQKVKGIVDSRAPDGVCIISASVTPTQAALDEQSCYVFCNMDSPAGYPLCPGEKITCHQEAGPQTQEPVVPTKPWEVKVKMKALAHLKAPIPCCLAPNPWF